MYFVSVSICWTFSAWLNTMKFNINGFFSWWDYNTRMIWNCMFVQNDMFPRMYLISHIWSGSQQLLLQLGSK